MKNFDFDVEPSSGALVGGAFVPRDVADLAIWKKTPFDAGHALCDLYLVANTTPGKHRLERGVIVDYVPGEILWSNKGLAERWGWKRENVERFMVALEENEIITRRKVDQYGKVIKLVSWGAANGSAIGSAISPPLGQPLGQPKGSERVTVGVRSIGEEIGEGGTIAAASAGCELPSESDVLAFGAGFLGDMARGIPPGIPESWLLSWFAWRMESPHQFPADWHGDVERRFRAAWVNGDKRARPTPGSGGASGAGFEKNGGGTSPAQRAFKLDKQLKDLDAQIDAFEDTNPDLCARLKIERKTVAEQRKELET